MSFSPNPLRFRIRPYLDKEGEFAFAPSYAFVRYDPRPPAEHEPKEGDDCGAPKEIDVVEVYIGGRDDITPGWWTIRDVRAIGALRLAVLWFRGEDFTDALRKRKLPPQDLLLLNALIDGARIQVRVHVDKHPSALFLDLRPS